MLLESGQELHRQTIDDSILTFTFNTENVQSIANGITYTLKCRAITQTDTLDLLYSSYQTVTAKPFGPPIEINYTIDDNTITVLINNNGSHITDILVIAPISMTQSLTDALGNANIIGRKTSETPIQNTSDPFIDLFVVTMNYDLVEKDSQPIFIVATNPGGMYYIHNLSSGEPTTI